MTRLEILILLFSSLPLHEDLSRFKKMYAVREIRDGKKVEAFIYKDNGYRVMRTWRNDLFLTND
jgi:hypothetical protein